MNTRYTAAIVNNGNFVQMPTWLFRGKYADLSANAKIAYALLRDRHSLSVQNGWIDDEGHVYMVYTQGELAEMLQVTRKTANVAIKTLEEYGLIEREQQNGYADKIYLTIPDDTDANNSCENNTQPPRKNDIAPIKKVHTPHVKITPHTMNQTNIARLKSHTSANALEKAPSSAEEKSKSKNDPDATECKTSEPDIDTAVKAYNDTAAECDLPQVLKLTPTRKTKLKARLKEHGAEGWQSAMTAIKASAFLRGKNGWRVTFDWLITNPENIAKVLEGAYSDTPKRASPPPAREGIMHHQDMDLTVLTWRGIAN